jgi:hypothetical protein
VYRGLLLQLSPCNQIVQRGLVAICLVRASTYLFSFWLFVKASNLNLYGVGVICNSCMV